MAKRWVPWLLCALVIACKPPTPHQQRGEQWAKAICAGMRDCR